MKKKDVIKDALLTAKELEEAAKNHAKDVIVEAFAPRLVDVIRQTINEEGPGPELPNLKASPSGKKEEEETESDEVQNKAEVSDAHPESISPDASGGEIKGKGKKHDLDRAAPAPGQMTEADSDEEDLDLPPDDEMEEGEDHDQGKLHFDTRDQGDSDFASPTINEEDDDSEDDDDLELEIDDMEDDSEDGDDSDIDVDQPPVEDNDDVFEQDDEPADDQSDNDEELDIPDELFDDEDDQEMQDKPESDEELSSDDSDDEDLGEADDEELDLDIDDDESDMEPQDMTSDDDQEFDEGLYVRREGQFVKVDPAEALDARMKDLDEEREKLANAVETLRGQLGEVNLFNAKMAHLVKLYESGLFSRPEKRRIAERLDSCKSIKQVQKTYTHIMNEADSRTVLDDIHDVINESRVHRNAKPTGETIYESDEVRRMKRLAGLED